MNKDISVPRSNMKALLAQASIEAQLVTATRFASALDSLIAHICKSEMNRAEIIELLGQESEKIHNSILNKR
ncbi:MULTISPECIES: DUF2732 family protein [Klebsiella]|uniref:DUF2732 family protein n=1 Tax=Klebsiella TaxID=570 RepID=UPI000E2D629B|nr:MULTISPECIES: DUF2732 family protein [Klebsiella]MCS5981202.1 DUF2732 domain-containing protein [Klebsiella pneumoniae subsp. pneumoniae]HBR1854222.1 DUF2732 family protein [Klebsiella quasipneumoniae subsp. quasipneumoniae]MDH1342416.1 DUF2732 domain-containing protein [Klebsiella michiganensis]SXE42456.1 Protein of uncharacterised function (DUF2732) [Klebsiella variicola]SXF49379.1 Protein of uncharacterised function (DUF2732) [Klebsiella variicola]